MSKKNFIAVYSLIFFSALPLTAHAGPIRDCMKWLSSLGETKPEPKKQAPYRDKNFLKWKKAFEKDDNVLPGAYQIIWGSSHEEATESFFFWWYPGNQFNDRVIPFWPGLAKHMLDGGDFSTYVIPTRKELLKERRDYKKNKGQDQEIFVVVTPEEEAAEATSPLNNIEFQALIAQLEADKTMRPPSKAFDPKDSEKELKTSLHYWWYPGNAFGPYMPKRFAGLALKLQMGFTIEGIEPTPEEIEAERAARKEQPVVLDDPGQPMIEQNKPEPKGAREAREIEIHEDSFDTSPTSHLTTGASNSAANHAADQATPQSSDPSGTMTGNDNNGGAPSGSP